MLDDLDLSLLSDADLGIEVARQAIDGEIDPHLEREALRRSPIDCYFFFKWEPRRVYVVDASQAAVLSDETEWALVLSRLKRFGAAEDPGRWDAKVARGHRPAAVSDAELDLELFANGRTLSSYAFVPNWPGGYCEIEGVARVGFVLDEDSAHADRVVRFLAQRGCRHFATVDEVRAERLRSLRRA